MQIQFRLRRASARLAVGLLATALPLVAADAAQAAFASANRLVTTSRPDLVSAAITGPSSAQFCFKDHAASVADVGGFHLGGYHADANTNSIGATAAGELRQRVDRHQPAIQLRAQVGEDAVGVQRELRQPRHSVASAGSTSQNGTRGLTTTAPDLTGISVVPGAVQQIAFSFDEPVTASSIVGVMAVSTSSPRPVRRAAPWRRRPILSRRIPLP